MRIMVINPNTSADFTESIDLIAQSVKSSDTEIVCTNPSFGPASIESEFDEILSSVPCFDVIISSKDDFDAFVIACYGNHPVVHSAREFLSQPVVGIMESSLHLASMIGHRYSIITSGERATTMFRNGVKAMGLENQCASIRHTSTPVLALAGDEKETVYQLILAESRKAIEEDVAEVISLGCAGMVGFAERLTDELGVPVIDGVVAGVKVAEALVACGLKTSKRLAYKPLEPKELIDMPNFLLSAYLESN